MKPTFHWALGCVTVQGTRLVQSPWWVGLDWGLLAHDSAPGPLATESRAFSHSFIVSESPIIMFCRGKICCLVYLIQSSIGHRWSTRSGAKHRGYSSEKQMVFALMVSGTERRNSQNHSFVRARIQGRTWHHTCMAGVYLGLPVWEGRVTEMLLWGRTQVNWPWPKISRLALGGRTES